MKMCLMKICLIPALLVCLTAAAFSQDANAQRYQALSDTMGETLSASNTKLEEFDQNTTYSGNGKVYVSYRHRYESLAKAIQESEARLNRLIQGHAPANIIKEERDKYEGFIGQLDGVKSDYDGWLDSVE